MPQFLILANDYQDADALNRRMSVREEHLKRVRSDKPSGKFIIGGARLNEKQEMTGSMLVVEFPDEAAVHDWIKLDPYVTGKVWEEISITPFRVATV